VARGRGDRDVRGSIEPAPWEENAHAREPLRQRKGREAIETCRSSIRRSVPSDVKHSVPRSSRAEPKLCGAPTSRKGRQVAGSARGAGKRSSHGWQKSIGRIARLARRGIARSRGGERKQGASQKEAKHRLTRGTSREKANRCASARRRSKVRVHSVRGFRLASSGDDGRRSRATARLALTGKATRGPSARRSISVTPSARSVLRAAHRSTKRSIGRASE